MSTSAPWLLIAAAGLGTFLLRLSFLALVHGEVPPLMQRILRLVPAAVLAAIVLPALAPATAAEVSTPTGWIRPAAAVVAVIVAVRSGSMLATLVAGMVALWLLGVAL